MISVLRAWEPNPACNLNSSFLLSLYLHQYPKWVSLLMATEPVCLKDFENYAKKYTCKSFFDFWTSGANDEQTLEENVESFKRLRLRPRVLRDVSNLDLSTKLLGEIVASPIGISPSSLHKLAHPEGEKATFKAAATFGIVSVLSSGCSVPLQQVAMASEGSLKWFQIYIHKDRNLTEMLIKQAEKSGYKALVVTVDLPVLGQRLNDKRNKLTIPEDKAYAHFPTDLISNSTDDSAIAKHVNSLFDSSLTWSDLDWLASLTSLPIILKGILTSEDAKIALKYDCVKAIWVSNHGGRQLDGVSSTIEALPEVVKAVNGKLEVYIDGGVRQGTDVLKALALGAKAVLIGRPVLWGLAYDGEEGVKKVLDILNEELKTAMALSGCSSLSDISPELVVHESYYRKSNL